MLDTRVITTISTLLSAHAQDRPHKIAFKDSRQRVTYGQLYERTARLAAHLLALGLEDGDRFMMYLDNSVEVVEGYLTAPRAGLVAVCANPQSTTSELEYMLDDSDARIVITDSQRLPAVMALATERERVIAIVLVGDEVDHLSVSAHDGGPTVILYEGLVASEAPIASPDSSLLDDWCWMLYTSGTTGRPKGVHLTQRGCLWVVGACWIPTAGLNERDRLLSALPLFHSYALVLCVVGVAATGATATVLPKFSPRATLESFAQEGTTIFPGVPTMFRYLLNNAEESLDAPNLRLCVSAGALMSASLNVEFEKFAGVPLLDGYGITETSTMVTMNSPTGGRVPGSCGLPLPGLTVRLVGPDDVDVLPGEEGELWVQGPNVMLGYHNLPDATRRSLTSGWYHTGDLARRDENGFIIISGRVKELIIRGGENIYPAEIEEALLTCESVQDVAVIALPHDALGEVPVACIVPVTPGGIDREEIIAVCKAKLSEYKVPAEFHEVHEIPRTGSGKIRRFHLHNQIFNSADIRAKDTA